MQHIDLGSLLAHRNFAWSKPLHQSKEKYPLPDSRSQLVHTHEPRHRACELVDSSNEFVFIHARSRGAPSARAYAGVRTRTQAKRRLAA